MRKTAALTLALAATLAGAQVPRGPGAGAPGFGPGMAPTVPVTAPPAREGQPPSKAPIPRGAVLEAVSGKVREIDRKVHTLTVEGADGPVTLSLDRNTMVYTEDGLGTVLDLAPGQQIRAGRNADHLAYWVQVRAPAKAEPSPKAPPGASGAGPAGDTPRPGAGPAPAPPTTTPAGTPPAAAPASPTPPAHPEAGARQSS